MLKIRVIDLIKQAKTRQPLTFEGRWMTFGRSLRGEVLSVTYFPAAQVKDKLLSPRPTYRNSEGSLRVQKEIDYDTVCPEIKLGRKGWRLNEFTSIAFEVWEQQGNLTLISKTELYKLDTARKEGVGRKQKESGLKRRRNEVKYTSTQAKKQKTSYASLTPLSTERNLAKSLYLLGWHKRLELTTMCGVGLFRLSQA
jgi:hypothetical protein